MDADLDGYGDDSQFVEVCELIPGYATWGDCDDIDHRQIQVVLRSVMMSITLDGQVYEGVGSTGTCGILMEMGTGMVTATSLNKSPSPNYVA